MQKPLAANYRAAKEVVRVAEKAGITLAVNQNMRYDHSTRALKTVLARGYLGDPVLAAIEMRAIPHWQKWIPELGGVTLLNMSIHHLDSFRFLSGDPESVYVSARTDPRTAFPYRDGIVLYILEYPSGLRAAAWDDVWAGPAAERADRHVHISDCSGKLHGGLPPGRGVADFPAYLSQLKQTGFSGTVSIELEHSPEPEKIAEWVKEAYIATNRLMQQPGIRG